MSAVQFRCYTYNRCTTYNITEKRQAPPPPLDPHSHPTSCYSSHLCPLRGLHAPCLLRTHAAPRVDRAQRRPAGIPPHTWGGGEKGGALCAGGGAGEGDGVIWVGRCACGGAWTVAVTPQPCQKVAPPLPLSPVQEAQSADLGHLGLINVLTGAVMGENSLQGREGGGWGLRIFPHKPPAPHIHTSHTSHTCCISPSEVASDCSSYDRCCSSTLTPYPPHFPPHTPAASPQAKWQATAIHTTAAAAPHFGWWSSWPRVPPPPG